MAKIKDKEFLVAALKTLREDALLALDGRWDRSDDGFEDQITLIDSVIGSMTNKEWDEWEKKRKRLFGG